MKSAFVSGLVNEDKESLSNQLSLWHHLTLRNILQRKLTGWIAKKEHLEDFLKERAKMASRQDTINLMTWKLNEIMQFLKIPVPKNLDINSLNTIGIEIEIQATALLRKIDKDFKGSSPDEMIRHLLIKVIENLSEQLKKKDRKSQDQVVQQILTVLQSMPIDQQEVLKGLLSIEEFTPDLIRRAIFDHTLATALASFMMMVRYTVYYEISKILIIMSGAAALYIARPYVLSFIPVVMFFFSPIAMATIGVWLTWFTDVYTNKQIQSFLLPVMVMSSILASSAQTKTPSDAEIIDTKTYEQNINLFIDFYNRRYTMVR